MRYRVTATSAPKASACSTRKWGVPSRAGSSCGCGAWGPTPVLHNGSVGLNGIRIGFTSIGVGTRHQQRLFLIVLSIAVTLTAWFGLIFKVMP